MKILKVLLSAAGTLFLAGCMFFCFVAGAPETKADLEIYVWMSAGFSLTLSAFTCVCINYILYLQKTVEELEKSFTDRGVKLDKNHFVT